MKITNEKLTLPVSVRMSEKLLESINEASDSLEIGQQDTIRFLIRIGLEHLEAIKYKVPQAVLEKSGIVRKSSKGKA